MLILCSVFFYSRDLGEMEELASCTSATERYDAFNAVRNRFGGEKKGHEPQKTSTVVSVTRRPSRKSDSLVFVKPPIALVQGENESASEEARLAAERIAKAKEMAARLEAVEQQKRRSFMRERPNSASHLHRTSLPLYDYPLDILREKDGSVVSLSSFGSDRGYSSKQSSGSGSPRMGSETNLLDDSSEQIVDPGVLRDRPWPAWYNSPDYKPPRRFVRNKLQQLCNSEESLVEETPELQRMRQTVESLESQSKGWEFEGVKPGYSPQTEPHQRRSSQVRLPVPDLLYNELGNENEDDNWATGLVQPDMGQFYTPENSPVLQMRKTREESQESPLAGSDISEVERLDSSSEEALSTQDSTPQDSPSTRRHRSFSDVSRPVSLHQYALRLQAKKNMRKLSAGVLPQLEHLPAELRGDSHLKPGADEVMERVLKWDESIGEWVFDGMKEPYSPKMEPKREKRRSRQIHFPAPDSAYEAFLSDDESWQAVLHADVQPGKFVNTPTVSGPTEDVDNAAAAVSEDCTQSVPQPEKTEEESKPPAEQGDDVAEKKNGAEEVSPATAGDESDESGQVISAKIAERAKLFGGLKRAKSFNVKHSGPRLVPRIRNRREWGSQDDSGVSAPVNTSHSTALDSAAVVQRSPSTQYKTNFPPRGDIMTSTSPNGRADRDIPTNAELQANPHLHSVTVQVTMAT